MKFQSGESGNPNGRPKGTGHRQEAFNALVIPHKTALFAKAIELALSGNEAMLRLFIERMIPAKPVDEPVSLNLTGELTLESAMDLGKNVLRLLDQKEITPEQAKQLLEVVRLYQDNVAVHEIVAKYKQLRSNYEIIKNNRVR